MQAPSPAETRPSSHRSRKWLREVAWIAMGLLIVIGVTYAIENWRGGRAWDAYVADATAAGERLDAASMIPPPVPDEQNFAMIPLFRPLFEYELKRDEAFASAVWKDPKHKEALDRLKQYGPSGTPSNSGNWRKGERTNLNAWQVHFAKRSGAPEPSAVNDAAQDVLNALETVAPMMDQLAEAAKRPHSRFPIRHEDVLSTLAPHVGPISYFVHIARLRASARLAAGDLNGAYEDAELGFRLCEAIANDSTLFSYLRRRMMQEISMAPLWEGLVDHCWTDEQLAELQRLLSAINHAIEFQRAIRSERNLNELRMLEGLRTDPGTFGAMFYLKQEYPNAVPKKFMSGVFRLMPRGWIDLNKAEVGRLSEKMLDFADASPPRFHPGRVQAFKDELEGHSGLLQDHRKVLARWGKGMMADLPQTSAMLQGTVNLAFVAVTLERHHLRHNGYPSDLSGIDPAVLPEGRSIPLDPVTGNPAHYRPTENGRFILYYEGWNQRDDRGEVVYRKGKNPRIDIEKGDWVWPQPVAP